MKNSRVRSHLTALPTAVLACAGLLSLSTAPAWATAGIITEFSLPVGSGDPINITTGPDGSLWFTLADGNAIEQTTVTDGRSVERVYHASGSSPMDVACSHIATTVRVPRESGTDRTTAERRTRSPSRGVLLLSCEVLAGFS